MFRSSRRSRRRSNSDSLVTVITPRSNRRRSNTTVTSSPRDSSPRNSLCSARNSRSSRPRSHTISTPTITPNGSLDCTVNSAEEDVAYSNKVTADDGDIKNITVDIEDYRSPNATQSIAIYTDPSDNPDIPLSYSPNYSGDPSYAVASAMTVVNDGNDKNGVDSNVKKKKGDENKKNKGEDKGDDGKKFSPSKNRKELREKKEGVWSSLSRVDYVPTSSGSSGAASSDLCSSQNSEPRLGTEDSKDTDHTRTAWISSCTTSSLSQCSWDNAGFESDHARLTTGGSSFYNQSNSSTPVTPSKLKNILMKSNSGPCQYGMSPSRLDRLSLRDPRFMMNNKSNSNNSIFNGAFGQMMRGQTAGQIAAAAASHDPHVGVSAEWTDSSLNGLDFNSSEPKVGLWTRIKTGLGSFFGSSSKSGSSDENQSDKNHSDKKQNHQEEKPRRISIFSGRRESMEAAGRRESIEVAELPELGFAGGGPGSAKFDPTNSTGLPSSDHHCDALGYGRAKRKSESNGSWEESAAGNANQNQNDSKKQKSTMSFMDELKSALAGHVAAKSENKKFDNRIQARSRQNSAAGQSNGSQRSRQNSERNSSNSNRKSDRPNLGGFERTGFERTRQVHSLADLGGSSGMLSPRRMSPMLQPISPAGNFGNTRSSPGMSPPGIVSPGRGSLRTRMPPRLVSPIIRSPGNSPGPKNGNVSHGNVSPNLNANSFSSGELHTPPALRPMLTPITESSRKSQESAQLSAQLSSSHLSTPDSTPRAASSGRAPTPRAAGSGRAAPSGDQVCQGNSNSQNRGISKVSENNQSGKRIVSSLAALGEAASSSLETHHSQTADIGFSEPSETGCSRGGIFAFLDRGAKTSSGKSKSSRKSRSSRRQRKKDLNRDGEGSREGTRQRQGSDSGGREGRQRQGSDSGSRQRQGSDSGGTRRRSISDSGAVTSQRVRQESGISAGRWRQESDIAAGRLRRGSDPSGRGITDSLRPSDSICLSDPISFRRPRADSDSFLQPPPRSDSDSYGSRHDGGGGGCDT